jgi:hypothetical protein
MLFQVNVLVLTLLKGQELGWVCLASCGLDVNLFPLTFIYLNPLSGHLQCICPFLGYQRGSLFSCCYEFYTEEPRI